MDWLPSDESEESIPYRLWHTHASNGIYPGNETQSRCHYKSVNGILVAATRRCPTKQKWGICWNQFTWKLSPILKLAYKNFPIWKIPFFLQAKNRSLSELRKIGNYKCINNPSDSFPVVGSPPEHSWSSGRWDRISQSFLPQRQQRLQ